MSEWFDDYGFAEVADGLLTGALPVDADDVAALAAAGVTCVFNLVRDEEYEEDARPAVVALLAEAGIAEKRLEVEDFGGLLPGQLEQSVSEVLAWLGTGERVYLHCRAGWQRSAAVAAGVVACRDGIAIAEAIERVRARRPEADPLPHQSVDLARW